VEAGIRTLRRTGTPAPTRSGRWRDQADFTARFTSADVTPMATVPRTAARPALRHTEAGRDGEPEAGVIGGVRADAAARRVKGVRVAATAE
jgi:hypothetical protein